MTSLVSIPNVEVTFIPAQTGETFKLGPITCRILEDGSHTDNRLGTAELTLPPRTPGPPPHWHEMHDETFYITSGRIRFHIPDTSSPPQTDGVDKATTDASVGDYMVVPIRAPHTFSNPFDEEARVLFTSTPAFYLNYFKVLSRLAVEDVPVPAEVNLKAMAMFATILADRKPRVPK